jgi:hypothetical protein
LLTRVGVTRQWAALDELVGRAGQIPEIEAVILIGSLASATADAVSDVDAILVIRESSFPSAYGQRHALHGASVAACWDHLTDPPSEVAAHKWIDESGVLVEVLLATASGPLRVAEPARVILGDPGVLSRTRRRPPIRRDEMTGSPDPIEAAYDRLKEAVRHVAPPSAT